MTGACDIARSGCGYGAKTQNQVPDANRAHKQHGGTNWLSSTRDAQWHFRCHDQRSTDRRSEPSHRFGADSRHSRSVVRPVGVRSRTTSMRRWSPGMCRIADPPIVVFMHRRDCWVCV